MKKITDKERLDWLTKHDADICKGSEWYIIWVGGQLHVSPLHKTPRQAIDHAIREGKK